MLVAVSGGADSICLLYALYRLRRLLRIRLEVFHFDHGLRPDSAGDAEYVRKVAERLGLPFNLVGASERPPRGASVEAWARGQRLKAAAYVRRDVDAAKIAFGHTLDDQAETVLMAALTGSGLDGLKGIDPATGPYVRPLIDVSRDDVEAFCRALHLRPRVDPTNRSARFLRNKLRLRAIPTLERATGRSVREPLARVAALLREDARELNRQALERWDDSIEETANGVSLSVARMQGLSRAISSRLVSFAIIRAGVPATAEAVDAVLDLVEGRPGRRRELPGGLKAVRAKEYISLSRSSPESRGR